MTQRFFNLQYGFTLIELIVAITIMAMLSSFGIASFVTYSRTQKLQAETQNFVTTLQLAKASAASQVKPLTCINTGSLDGYEVKRSSATTYTISAVCGGTADSTKTTTLATASRVRFSQAAPLTLTFHTLSGIVSFNPEQATDYVDISLQEIESGAQKTVRVYTDGRINVL